MISVSVSKGSKNPTCKRHEFETLEELASILNAATGLEAWWSPHTWNGDRRGGKNWQHTIAAVLDIDHSPKGLPEDTRAAIEPIVRALGANLWHLTPNGARVCFVFARTCSDAERFRAVAEELSNRATNALKDAGLLASEGKPGLQVDSVVTKDLARLVYTPRATAKGIERTDTAVVIGDEIDIDTIEIKTPSMVSNVSRGTSKPRSESTSERAAEYAARYNRERAREWSGPCPICGADSMFGPGTTPHSWHCDSPSHPGERDGYALDIDAHIECCSKADQLKREGYWTTPAHVETSFTDAAARYNLDHYRDFGRQGSGDCPVCGKHGCFGNGPIAGKWSCFSDTHVQLAGLAGKNASVIGDALDLDSQLEDRSPTEHLIATGYLERKVPEQREAPDDVPAIEAYEDDVPKERPLTMTDLGNADKLVELHQDRLRFVPGVGWHHWDGKRWARSEDGSAARIAARDVAFFYQDKADSLQAAADALPDGDEKKAAQKHASVVLAHARRCESVAAINAMVAAAEDRPEIRLAAHELDADGWLLGCENGTIDLKDGRLMPHLKMDNITKSVNAFYDPDARYEPWERVLDWAVNGDQEFAEYLQMVFGYCLTASVEEQCFFIFYGQGGTGKSTIMGAFLEMMGDYAQSASFETFLKQREGTIRNDLACLRGARHVQVEEVTEGREFDTATIKSLVGGNRIKARFLHQENFEYKPHFKIFAGCNDKPIVKFDDSGTWRRVHVITLDRKVPESQRILGIEDDLRTNPKARAAVLAYAVKGCLKYIKAGCLKKPRCVEDAVREYRDENDRLGPFIEDRCEIAKGAYVTVREMKLAYLDWCDSERDRHPYGPKTFGKIMRAKGFREAKSTIWGKEARRWHGIKLKD